MKIKKIKVNNFKSFKELDLELGNFNVIIGANASGKSNFVQIFNFLRDIEGNNFKNAIAMNGGIDALLNIHCQNTHKNLEIQFLLESPFIFGFNNEGILNITHINSSFSFKPDYHSKTVTVYEDKCSLAYSVSPDSSVPNEHNGLILYTLINGKPTVEFSPPELSRHLPVSLNDLLTHFYKNDRLLFQQTYPTMGSTKNFFYRMGIYDIDPRKAKEPTAITGKAELERDAGNLALILETILQDKDKQRMLTNLVASLLPFVNKVGTEKFMDRSLTLSLQEKYYANKLRSDLLSDGTVNVTALLIAMYFEDNDVIFIEEPERNLHPHLIAGLVEMMKEVSKKKQIFITTHSPELIKRAGIENLLLVSRNKEGNSVVTRPRDSRQLKVFLENELGLDDLFTQNLLDLQ